MATREYRSSRVRLRTVMVTAGLGLGAVALSDGRVREAVRSLTLVPTAEAQGRASKLPPPQVLTEEQARRSLDARGQGMRQRYEARQARRRAAQASRQAIPKGPYPPVTIEPRRHESRLRSGN